MNSISPSVLSKEKKPNPHPFSYLPMPQMHTPKRAPAEAHSPQRDSLTWALFGMAFFYVILATNTFTGADPINSRLATVYSLTRYGTFFIDRPPQEQPIRFEQHTVDKVMVKGEQIGKAVRGGRLISSKPPILPLLMTAEYLGMRAALGWDLDNDPDIPRILYVMTLTLVGLAYVLTLLYFDRILSLFMNPSPPRFLMLLCLAFATQLWGYSTSINNHVPGACTTVIALYYGLGIALEKLPPTPRRFLLFGLASALTFTLDMPATLYPALAGLALLRKHPRMAILWAGAGAFVPLAIHFTVMLHVTGSPLPVQMHPELYQFDSSYWRHPHAIDALSEPKPTYLFHMTVGRCGLFSLYPILLLGPAAALSALLFPRTPHRAAVLTGAFSFLLITAYYAAKTNNYGGQAYGFRWYIASMPALLLMSLPLWRTFRRPWQWALLSLLIGLSFYSAWECTQVKWRANGEWPCRFLGPSYHSDHRKTG